MPPPLVPTDVKFDAVSGDYYPIIYFNDYWNLQKDYYPINESLASLPLRVSFCPLSLWRWQLYAAQSAKSPWNFLGDELYEQSDEEQDSVKVRRRVGPSRAAGGKGKCARCWPGGCWPVLSCPQFHNLPGPLPVRGRKQALGLRPWLTLGVLPLRLPWLSLPWLFCLPGRPSGSGPAPSAPRPAARPLGSDSRSLLTLPVSLSSILLCPPLACWVLAALAWGCLWCWVSVPRSDCPCISLSCYSACPHHCPPTSPLSPFPRPPRPSTLCPSAHF